MIDTVKLRELAKAIPNKEWYPVGHSSGKATGVCFEKDGFGEVVASYTPYEESGSDYAEYIAAANPVVVLEILNKLERLEKALDGILKNVALDWYVQQFGKSPDFSNGNTGIAARIHNAETLQRVKIAFERARQALTPTPSEGEKG